MLLLPWAIRAHLVCPRGQKPPFTTVLTFSFPLAPTYSPFLLPFTASPSSLIVIALAWELVRKCRSSGTSPQDQWVRLDNGSSVRVPFDRRNPSYRGPVSSLLHREADDGHGYVPARMGNVPREMSLDGAGMSQFQTYDPPVRSTTMADSSYAPSVESSYPPSILTPGARPMSTETDKSNWSGFTFVQSERAEKTEEETHLVKDTVRRFHCCFLCILTVLLL